MADISKPDTHTGTDAASILRIPQTTTNGEDATTSESRFAITSENTDRHHTSPVTVPQNHSSIILKSNTLALEETTATAGHREHVTFGNNQSSLSRQKCKTTSGEGNVQNWESSPLCKIASNADSTASATISSNGCISITSSEDGRASPNEVTNVVFENISTVTGDTYTAPINMATSEDSIAALAPEVSFISTTVLGDIYSPINSGEAIPDPGDISNISGEKTASSVGTLSAVSTEDTPVSAPSVGSHLVFEDLTGMQEVSGAEDCTRAGSVRTTVPGDFSANTASDSGEISHITLKKVPPPLPQDTTILLQDTPGVFATDSSAIIPAFLTTTGYLASDLPVISGSTNDLRCNNNTSAEDTQATGGPRGSFTNRNKTDKIPEEADTSVSAVPIATSGDAFKASTEGLNVCRTIINTVCLETTRCPVSTDSGNISVISGQNVRNITAAHLHAAILQEPFRVIPGNVTNASGARCTSTTILEKKPTSSMTHEDTSVTHYGERSTNLSSGNSVKPAKPKEKATPDSENSTTEPNSIIVSGNSHATVCAAIKDVLDNTIKEDIIATTPENIDRMEASTSAVNGVIVIAGENHITTLEKTSGDSTTNAPFRRSPACPLPVGTSTTATQGYAFTNTAGNVTIDCGSAIVSEGSVGDTATVSGFGGSAIPGNDAGMRYRVINSSVCNDASIGTALGETFIVSQDTTLNISTTISSQNGSGCSAKSQVGQYSGITTGKNSTVIGNFTPLHRDTDTTEVTLSIPTAPVPAADARSTPAILEDGNIAASGRASPPSQNTHGTISEELTASTLSEDVTKSMTSINTAPIHFETAVPAAVPSGEFESTDITCLAPRETTCSTGNDTMMTSSGCTLDFCVSASAKGELPGTILEETAISLGKPILECISIHTYTVSPDSASAHPTDQDRKLSVADDSKILSNNTMVVPRDISSGPAINISQSSREINTSALKDVANNTSDSSSINATKGGDTSEVTHYERRITSQTESVLRCVAAPDSLFSNRTDFQEASTSPGDTTTVFSHATEILEHENTCHAFVSMHSKNLTTIVQTPDTASIWEGYISHEGIKQSESAPTANATSASGDSKIQSESPNIPLIVGTKNITSHEGTGILKQSSVPDSILSIVISGTCEATPIPEGSRHAAATPRDNYTFAAGDATTTKFKAATTARASGDFVKTTTVLKDTTTFTTTSTGATTTVTALKDTVMTAQTSMRDISTVSRNKTATILEETSTQREIVTSEEIASTTLGDVMTQSKVLNPEIISSGETSVGNITPKAILSNDSSVYYTDIITANSLATPNTINIPSDTISTPNNAPSEPEITASLEGILASRNNSTITLVGIQNQTTIPEALSIVPEAATFATEENVTDITTSEARIAHTVPNDIIMSNITEDKTNHNVTINSSENAISITGTAVSPCEGDSETPIPADTTTSALGKTVPSEKRFYSGDAASTTTSLKEVCAHPDYQSPTEAFSTSTSTFPRDTRQLAELVTLCQSTVSVSENTSSISETSTGFGNPTSPLLFLQSTDLSAATEDTAAFRTTTGNAAFADSQIITIAPGDTLTTPNESNAPIAISVPEPIPTTSGAALTSTGGHATETDAAIAQYMITSPTVAEETIRVPGDNITDIAIPRNKDILRAVGDIHASTLIPHGNAINADGDTISEPTTCKDGASLIPTCPAMIPLRENLTPSTTTASEDTSTLAPTGVAGKTGATVFSRKYPAPEAAMVLEGKNTTPRETFVPKTTAHFTEAPLSRPATELSFSSSSEVTISPAEKSMNPFCSGQTAASRDASSNESIADENIIVMSTSSSTSSSVNITLVPCNTGRSSHVFEDDACSASGHPYTSESTAATVLEDTAIVSGNNCAASEVPVIITRGKDTLRLTKVTPTTRERAFIIDPGKIPTGQPRDTTDTTTTESSVISPPKTTDVQGETPIISPEEEITVAYIKTTCSTRETAMIKGGSSDEAGVILTTSHREINIATFGKATDSTTRGTFVVPSETLTTCLRETLSATSGEITGTTCTSIVQTSDNTHEDTSAASEEKAIGTAREAAPVRLGKATEMTVRETPTITHRKISAMVPQKTFTVTNSGASSAIIPGEIPTTVFAVATHEASHLPVVTPDTCMPAPSKIVSASQAENRTLKPVTPLPYWSVTLIGIMVIIFLLAGFCLVIYYVMFFILVAYSASLSSSTFP